jgi:hypothetical protein
MSRMIKTSVNAPQTTNSISMVVIEHRLNSIWKRPRLSQRHDGPRSQGVDLPGL